MMVVMIQEAEKMVE
jgi:hypothetical protein